MRNFIVLVGLVVLLLVANQVVQMLQNWHYVVPAEAGQPLYVATFDGQQDDWVQFEGRLSAQVVDSAMRIEVDQAGRLPISTAAPYFRDFDLRVRARPVDGPINNGYGVVFRIQDPDNYYMFLVSSDGYYRVQRAVDGQEKDISTWIPSPLVHQGLNVDNWLRVVAQGEDFHFYINGEAVELCIPNSVFGVSTYSDHCQDGTMLPMLTDSAIPNGKIGVVAQSLDERGVVVDFDDLVVYGPERAS